MEDNKHKFKAKFSTHHIFDDALSNYSEDSRDNNQFEDESAYKEKLKGLINSL